MITYQTGKESQKWLLGRIYDVSCTWPNVRSSHDVRNRSPCKISCAMTLRFPNSITRGDKIQSFVYSWSPKVRCWSVFIDCKDSWIRIQWFRYSLVSYAHRASTSRWQVFLVRIKIGMLTIRYLLIISNLSIKHESMALPTCPGCRRRCTHRPFRVISPLTSCRVQDLWLFLKRIELF
jgi:hypothetical protein